MPRSLLFIFIVSVISAQETEYFQQNVDYNIEVTLNDTNHTLSAFEKLIYSNNSPDTLGFIWFHIWPNAYKDDSTAYAKQAGPNSRFAKSDSSSRGFIDSLDFSVDGERVDWTYHPEWSDVLKVNLKKPLNPGESIIIETPFFVKLPKVFSRLGHTGKHYEITQWYPKPAVFDNKGWHPMPYLNQGEFYSEFGSFDVRITLPKDYRIMATGDLINGESEYSWLDSLASVSDSINALSDKDFDNWLKSKIKISENKNVPDTSDTELKTLHFHQKRVHDFAWFADKKWIVQKGNLSLTDSTQNVTLWSFYLPKNALTWKNSIEYLHDSGYWYSKYYGDYPYKHLTAVDGDLSAGGGMEYPNITVIASMPSKALLEMVIMHEVGHNWFYGILGTNERYHTWMDEGLNEYTCIRYWQDKYGKNGERFVISELVQNKLGIAKNLKFSWLEYFQYAMTAKSSSVQPLSLKANEYNGSNYGLNYSKTAVFTRFLQHYLGDEKMDEIMQDYYETWKYKHPYPEDLRKIFEKHTNKDLNWYFEGVLETTDYLDYSIDKKRNQFTISNHGELKTPIEVVFYGSQHNELERRWLEGFDWIKSVQGPVGTWYAIIDPDENMPDVKRENNSTRKELYFNWVWDQPNYYDHEVNILPWLFSYNFYNGWTPGAMLYKGGTPGYTSTTSIQPMWDFNNNQAVLKFRRVNNFDPNNFFRASSLTFSGMRYQGNTGGTIKFDGSYGEEESKNISANINYSSIESGVLDTVLYETGSFSTFSIDYSYSRNLSGILNQSQFKVGIQLGQGFTSAWTEANLNLKFSKKYEINIRTWAGSFLNDDNVPNQFRSFISGGVDPNFSSAVFDRTGNSEMVILKNQYIKQGPGMRGYVMDKNDVPLSTTGVVWGVNITPNVPFFIDLASGEEFKDTYTTVGLKFGPIILPLYQSWELDQKVAKDWNWIKERIRISFSFDISNLGQIMF